MAKGTECSESNLTREQIDNDSRTKEILERIEKRLSESEKKKCKKCYVELPNDWKYKRCVSCLGVFWTKAIVITGTILGTGYGLYKNVTENDGESYGSESSDDDSKRYTCSQCGASMRFADEEVLDCPSCRYSIDFDDYDTEDEWNEHYQSIKESNDEPLCAAGCGGYPESCVGCNLGGNSD